MLLATFIAAFLSSNWPIYLLSRNSKIAVLDVLISRRALSSGSRSINWIGITPTKDGSPSDVTASGMLVLWFVDVEEASSGRPDERLRARVLVGGASSEVDRLRRCGSSSTELWVSLVSRSRYTGSHFF